MLPLVFLGGLLDGVGGGGASDWSLGGLGAAVAVVVIVGLDSAVRILLGRVDHIVVGGGGSASSGLLVQPGRKRRALSKMSPVQRVLRFKWLWQSCLKIVLNLLVIFILISGELSKRQGCLSIFDRAIQSSADIEVVLILNYDCLIIEYRF